MGFRSAKFTITALAVLFVTLHPLTAGAGPDERYTSTQLTAIYALSPIGLPPLDPTDRFASDPSAARFGQYLFFERRSSRNNAVACATCHRPEHAFTDGRALAKGLDVGRRNAPTLLNVAYNHWFFWDGRVDSLWAQPLQVFENPKEMGSDRLHVARVVYEDRRLRRAYERIFGPMPPLSDATRFPAHARPDPDSNAPLARAWRAMAPADRGAVNEIMANLGKALEAYERKLVSSGSPFDRFVAALKDGGSTGLEVLSPAARRGLALFVGEARCTLCHSGPTMSDGEFHNTGLLVRAGEARDEGRAEGIREFKANPFKGAGEFSDAPNGTAKDRLSFLPSADSQIGKFKTPTLRNVARTGPYMHDGSLSTLEEVVKFYAKGKAASGGTIVGQGEATLELIPHLSPQQVSDLVAFLESLDGAPLRRELMRQPVSP